MAFILLGSLGFAAGYWADLGGARRLPWLKGLLWALGLGLQAAALALLSLDSPRFGLDGWAVLAGWAILPLCCLLLLSSLFIELPLARTYWGDGRPSRIVTTGTYALVRHPSVLAYLLLLLALLLVSRSQLLLVGAPLWAALDILWALGQEKRLASRSTVDYTRYKAQTPFLIPTWRSLKSCGKTLVPSRRGHPWRVTYVRGG